MPATECLLMFDLVNTGSGMNVNVMALAYLNVFEDKLGEMCECCQPVNMSYFREW